MVTNAVKPFTLSSTVVFRGVEVDLKRCAARTRQMIETALERGHCSPNPLAELEALEERTTAQAVAQLSCSLLTEGMPAIDIEDALCELRTHMDEHFTQRKLVRLYER
ncbi:hypothetical protein JNO04_05220 [Halomonas sp. MC140]|nr:hypothetical protein [Halomonas sp. MC140]MDN7131755.1 hypothetical protein [Halomonas sp. MC140]